MHKLNADDILRRSLACLVLALVSAVLIGCSMAVPPDEVYGLYVASYPFGTEMITLNQDGTFVQEVKLGNKESATVRGTWTFEPNESRVNLYGAMIVTDRFDHLRTDWHAVTKGIVSWDVERRWFKVLMGSASTYPYVKQ